MTRVPPRVALAVVAGIASMALLGGCGSAPLRAVVATRTPDAGRTSTPPADAPAPSPSAPSPSGPGMGPTATPSLDPVSPLAPSDIPTASGGPGPVPVVHRVDTRDRVVFITIDDGYTKDPAVVSLLHDRGIPVTPFLTVDAVRGDPAYFSTVEAATGQTPQDHSLTHPDLKGRSLAAQTAEICTAADTLGGWYGSRPWMFRPPYGSYDRTTLVAARGCGIAYVVLWDVSLPHSVLRYASGTKLQPGDIILVHWRPHLAADLASTLDTIAAEGLRVGALQDYLPKPAA